MYAFLNAENDQNWISLCFPVVTLLFERVEIFISKDKIYMPPSNIMNVTACMLVIMPINMQGPIRVRCTSFVQLIIRE